MLCGVLASRFVMGLHCWGTSDTDILLIGAYQVLFGNLNNTWGLCAAVSHMTGEGNSVLLD